MNLLLLNAKTRYALLKKELREIPLEKDQPGYKSRYFYVSLQEMQRIIVPLEIEYGLTSEYTERVYNYDGVLKVFAVRTLKDLATGQFVTETVIDITNLKTPQDIYELGSGVINIDFPKDAPNTLLYDFFEPQTAGAISTYFQRYTYNQLYDFQETKEDSIEARGRLKDRAEDEEDPKKETGKKGTTKKTTTPKDVRKADKAAEIRSKIKEEFTKEFVIQHLGTRKMSSMNEKEALEFYNELSKDKTELDSTKTETTEEVTVETTNNQEDEL